jgi:hypothetical protein
MVIQINGKKRGVIKVKNDISEKELIKEIMNMIRYSVGEFG